MANMALKGVTPVKTLRHAILCVEDEKDKRRYYEEYSLIEQFQFTIVKNGEQLFTELTKLPNKNKDKLISRLDALIKDSDWKFENMKLDNIIVISKNCENKALKAIKMIEENFNIKFTQVILESSERSIPNSFKDLLKDQ